MQDGFIKQRAPWQFLGQRLCFGAFLVVSGMSKRKCQKFLTAIKAGQLAPPEDGRSERTMRDTPKREHAEAFFQYLYDHLAEPLAEGEASPEPDGEDTCFQDEFYYWIKGEAGENPVAAATAGSDLPQKCFGTTYFLKRVLDRRIF